MPTVEDYFDDDTDLPLPSAPHLPNTGMRGALLEEIGAEDELDFGKLAEQGRGEYGADSRAPPPSADKGKMTVREEAGDVRPTTQTSSSGPKIDPNTPMGGFMGDMMKFQEVEEQRMAKLRKQFGNTKLADDPSVYKMWYTVYPRYFDAKASVSDGRRVSRKSALWWPQATHIARACTNLGLRCVLEPDKTHPADWDNPGRVKVQFEVDGKSLNPAVKNRTQLYAQIAKQIQAANPKLVPTAEESKPRGQAKPKDAAVKKSAKGKGKAAAAKEPVVTPHSTRAPDAPRPIPALDERLPIHSPLAPTGVAVSAVKRDIKTEKEQKKKGITGGDDAGGSAKAPKPKRVVVRGRSPTVKNESIDGVTAENESKKDTTPKLEDGGVRVPSQKDSADAAGADAGEASTSGVKKEPSPGGLGSHTQLKLEADADKRDEGEDIDVDDGLVEEDEEDEDEEDDEDDNVPRITPREYVKAILAMGEPSIDPETYRTAVHQQQKRKDQEAQADILDMLRGVRDVFDRRKR